MISLSKFSVLSGLALLALIVVAFLLFYAHARPRSFQLNRGSALHAVREATQNLCYRWHANSTNALELNSEVLQLVEFIRDKPGSPATISNTICVIARNAVTSSSGEPLRYIGLGSGRVFLVPERFAQLGSVLSTQGVPHALEVRH
jgi:hypothetical protein